MVIENWETYREGITVVLDDWNAEALDHCHDADSHSGHIHNSTLSSTGRSDTDVTFTDDEELDVSGAEDCDHTSGTWFTLFCTMLFTLFRTVIGYFRN